MDIHSLFSQHLGAISLQCFFFFTLIVLCLCVYDPASQRSPLPHHWVMCWYILNDRRVKAAFRSNAAAWQIAAGFLAAFCLAGWQSCVWEHSSKKRNFLSYNTFQFEYSLTILCCCFVRILQFNWHSQGWVRTKSCTANKTQPSPTIFNKKSSNPAMPVIAAAGDNNHRGLIWLLEFRRAHTAAVNHSPMSHNG